METSSQNRHMLCMRALGHELPQVDCSIFLTLRSFSESPLSSVWCVRCHASPAIGSSPDEPSYTAPDATPRRRHGIRARSWETRAASLAAVGLRDASADGTPDCLGASDPKRGSLWGMSSIGFLGLLTWTCLRFDTKAREACPGD